MLLWLPSSAFLCAVKICPHGSVSSPRITPPNQPAAAQRQVCQTKSAISGLFHDSSNQIVCFSSSVGMKCFYKPSRFCCLDHALFGPHFFSFSLLLSSSPVVQNNETFSQNSRKQEMLEERMFLFLVVETCTFHSFDGDTFTCHVWVCCCFYCTTFEGCFAG